MFNHNEYKNMCIMSVIKLNVLILLIQSFLVSILAAIGSIPKNLILHEYCMKLNMNIVLSAAIFVSLLLLSACCSAHSHNECFLPFKAALC